MTRSAQRTRTRTGAAALVLALGLTACAPEIPTPDPEAPPVAARPVLAPERVKAVLADVGTALEQASTELDRDAVDARLTGPARKIRRTELLVAEVLETTEYVTQLPTATKSVMVSTAETWPRVVLAVSEQPELQTERLLVLEQPSARAQYQLWAWVRLFPNVELPAFAAAATGSAQAAADAEGYVMTPDAAVAAYADVLSKGSKSEHAELFADDPFRQQIAQIKKLQNEALEAADGKQTLTFSAVPGSVRALETVDGGVVVVGEMTALEDRVAEKGATIAPGSRIEKALARKLKLKNEMSISYTSTVALYLPVEGTDEAPVVLGVEHVATAADIPS